MISVTFWLVSDTKLSFPCPETGPLFDQIEKLVAGLDDVQNSGSEVLQLQIDGPEGSRGIAISTRNILAIETSPASVFDTQRPPTVAQTAPYIRIPDFMPSAAHKQILNYALSREGDYSPSTVKASLTDENKRDASVRDSLVLRELGGLPAEFEQDLRTLIPDAMQVLDMDLPQNFELEFQLTAHNDGAFYRMHRDNNSPSTGMRQLTFVYYFHHQPQAYSGGEIRLFDTLKDSEAAAVSSVSIFPDDNSLLLFPSGIPHEVTEVSCPSKNFEASRFTLNGWVRFEEN